jgi:hypothetical protein
MKTLTGALAESVPFLQGSRLPIFSKQLAARFESEVSEASRQNYDPRQNPM